MIINPISLSQDLIKIPSISGEKSNINDFLNKILKNLSFKTELLTFSGDGGAYEVNNLHAIYNPKNSKNILYFAGHLDVVPSGSEDNWKFPPFSATINEGNLYGRGVVDMKSAIACFISAISEIIENNVNLNLGLGFIITGDEEAESINGTKKILKWMKEEDYKISACIIGEPTSADTLGDTIKIGRRGSVRFSLKVNGKQGHVAYPQHAVNPITSLNNIMKILKENLLDNGSEFFDPSNLEFTSIHSPNDGENVIPNYAQAKFNIRFNDKQNSQDLIKWVEYICSKSVYKQDYELDCKVSGESFLCKPKSLSQISKKVISDTLEVNASLSTSGGTSDARFIKDHCDNIIELGLLNKTAHQINEHAKLQDITNLKEIYKKIILDYGNI